MATSAEESCGNGGPDKVHGNMAAPTPSQHCTAGGFPPAPSPRKPKPLLALWKCYPMHPEAFQPVKLKQGCKAETLMKCINLERRASVLITVWSVYEPSEEQKGTRRRLRRTVQWPVHPYIWEQRCVLCVCELTGGIERETRVKDVMKR